MTTTTKSLKATFSIPRTKIKNANLAMNHIVAAQKSAWIREYAETVWADAVKEQHSVTAIEPNAEDLIKIEVRAEIQDMIDNLKSFDDDIKSKEEEKASHAVLKKNYQEWKKELRSLKKTSKDVTETLNLEQKIADYDKKTAAITADIKRLKAAKASAKQRSSKDIAKELRKIEGSKRRNYISQKLSLNSQNQLFNKCAVIVRVSNITAHEFDAANFYPTVKPILDAATDTGVVWPDDNNSIISGGVLFLSGGKSATKDYIFEIEIMSEWPWDN